MSVVIEGIKQRVGTKAAQVKRYDDRVRQLYQNRLFNTNQRQLFNGKTKRLAARKWARDQQRQTLSEVVFETDQYRATTSRMANGCER